MIPSPSGSNFLLIISTLKFMFKRFHHKCNLNIEFCKPTILVRWPILKHSKHPATLDLVWNCFLLDRGIWILYEQLHLVFLLKPNSFRYWIALQREKNTLKRRNLRQSPKIYQWDVFLKPSPKQDFLDFCKMIPQYSIVAAPLEWENQCLIAQIFLWALKIKIKSFEIISFVLLEKQWIFPFADNKLT